MRRFVLPYHLAGHPRCQCNYTCMHLHLGPCQLRAAASRVARAGRQVNCAWIRSHITPVQREVAQYSRQQTFCARRLITTAASKDSLQAPVQEKQEQQSNKHRRTMSKNLQADAGLRTQLGELFRQALRTAFPDAEGEEPIIAACNNPKVRGGFFLHIAPRFIRSMHSPHCPLGSQRCSIVPLGLLP